MNDELVKRLQECIEPSDKERGLSFAPTDLLREAVAALTAQQEPTEPVATEGYWWCPNCKAEIGAYHVTYQECHEDCGHKVEWITPVTAPLSGVRAGMLRAAEICKEWEGKLSQGAGYAIRTAREAITRAADQVNADGCTRSHPHDDMNAECERKTTIARETNSRANAMQAIKEDAPVMKAWNNYKSSDEFKNTRKWALHEEHVDGSLWAAFYAGFFACAVDQINAEGHEVSGLGCDYQGSHFGASYEDARCIDGYLWDLDSCDEPGGPLRHGGEIPCPQCNSQASAPHSASQIDIAWIVSKNGLPPVHLSKIDGWSVEAVVTEPASQPDPVAVPRDQLEHWAEYWNGSANEKAMSDALEHILGEVDDLLRAAQEAK